MIIVHREDQLELVQSPHSEVQGSSSYWSLVGGKEAVSSSSHRCLFHLLAFLQKPFTVAAMSQLCLSDSDLDRSEMMNYCVILGRAERHTDIQSVMAHDLGGTWQTLPGPGGQHDFTSASLPFQLGFVSSTGSEKCLSVLSLLDTVQCM